jgi:hypothetical protein
VTPRPQIHPRLTPLCLLTPSHSVFGVGCSWPCAREHDLVPPPRPVLFSLLPLPRMRNLVGAGSALGLFTRAATGGAADLQGRAHGSGGVTALEVLGGGQHVCSGGRDGSVSVWDVRTGARLSQADGHGDAVTEVASLGGSSVLTTSLDGTVKVWDVSIMAVHTFGKMHRQVSDLAARVGAAKRVAGECGQGACPQGARVLSGFCAGGLASCCAGGHGQRALIGHLQTPRTPISLSPPFPLLLRACAARRVWPLRSRTSASS